MPMSRLALSVDQAAGYGAVFAATAAQRAAHLDWYAS